MARVRVRKKSEVAPSEIRELVIQVRLDDLDETERRLEAIVRKIVDLRAALTIVAARIKKIQDQLE